MATHFRFSLCPTTVPTQKQIGHNRDNIGVEPIENLRAVWMDAVVIWIQVLVLARVWRFKSSHPD
jgi:hypothetical protein